MEHTNDIISQAIAGLRPDSHVAVKAQSLKSLGGKVAQEVPDERLVSVPVRSLQELLSANIVVKK